MSPNQPPVQGTSDGTRTKNVLNASGDGGKVGRAKVGTSQETSSWRGSFISKNVSSSGKGVVPTASEKECMLHLQDGRGRRKEFSVLLKRVFQKKKRGEPIATNHTQARRTKKKYKSNAVGWGIIRLLGKARFC